MGATRVGVVGDKNAKVPNENSEDTQSMAQRASELWGWFTMMVEIEKGSKESSSETCKSNFDQSSNNNERFGMMVVSQQTVN